MNISYVALKVLYESLLSKFYMMPRMITCNVIDDLVVCTALQLSMVHM